MLQGDEAIEKCYKMKRMNDHEHPRDLPVTRDHRRQWRDCVYVYPVIARRSRGLSVGVNLNTDKRCNFACVYCRINRHLHRELSKVHVTILGDELRLALSEAIGGGLWAEPRFASTPEALRRINDIALSGDGEPTCLADFDQVVVTAAVVKRDLGLDDVKIVVISNASQFHRPQFVRALATLEENNGEIWAKLDAGTEEFFRRVNRPGLRIPLRLILDNITAVARRCGVVIQSLFFRIDGVVPPVAQIQAYCDRLEEIAASGGKIKLVQVHTIARSPAEAFVSRLADAELDAIAQRIRSAVGTVPVETYYGADVPPQIA